MGWSAAASDRTGGDSMATTATEQTRQPAAEASLR